MSYADARDNLKTYCGRAVDDAEVVVIPMMDYGRMNAKRVVELGLSHIKD